MLFWLLSNMYMTLNNLPLILESIDRFIFYLTDLSTSYGRLRVRLPGESL